MGKYDNIINMPYPPKNKKAVIKPEDRAAQFSSFKALNGFDEAIDEEIRIYEENEESD